MEEIAQLIRSLNVFGTLKGFKYLAKSVEIAVEDENALFGITKIVYPAVAGIYHTTPSCVERNIRTIINTCWERGGQDRLFEIAGYCLAEKPTSGEMIDILANYMRKHQK